LYNSAIRQAHTISEIVNERPASFYHYQFEIQKKLYNLHNVELKRFEKNNVEDIINNLDYFYLAEKLKWYCRLLIQQNLISHEYKLLFIDEIINHLSKYRYEDIPLIQIYYLIYLTQKDSDNEAHYYSLKELLYQNWQSLPIEEAKDAYTSLLSYCLKKLNTGNSLFVNEFFLLSKELLNTDILIATGKMDPWYFRNAILISLRLGEYNWAENFLIGYEDKLPVDFRKSAVSYNRALVYFYQKKYDKVITLLQSVEYDELVYNLSSKSILLAVYYELDEDESLNSLMESFKVYLSRHKEISDIQRISYLNLIKYTRKLLKLIPGDIKEIEKIKQEIEEDKKVGIASMKWVYEKLAELE
jgi:hypothetical protein